METTICQSCGMPVTAAQHFGTNANGSPNGDYCCFCFQNGHFTQDVTMEQKIEHSEYSYSLLKEAISNVMERPSVKMSFFPNPVILNGSIFAA
jgi:hypothetical protein